MCSFFLEIFRISACRRRGPHPFRIPKGKRDRNGDGSTKTAELHTDEAYLGPALLASEELGVEGENVAYGLYIQTVDGETASDAGRTYWSLSKDGEITPNGADLTPIADGERYELTLTKGSW